MTPFELTYLALEPFLPPLYGQVRHALRSMMVDSSGFLLLDVGGRKSHYTIGLSARIVLTDVPRRTDLQRRLDVGIDRSMIEQLRARRSNVEDVLLDDMIQSSLPDERFDGVVAVEVLEHVEDDAKFLHNVVRVLRRGGFFLMTTPNGDYVDNTNPDHKRHYTRDQLEGLLAESFDQPVDVRYAIRGGALRRIGLRSWSAVHPFRTIGSAAANLGNRFQSRPKYVAERAQGTHHLMAVAMKVG